MKINVKFLYKNKFTGQIIKRTTTLGSTLLHQRFVSLQLQLCPFKNQPLVLLLEPLLFNVLKISVINFKIRRRDPNIFNAFIYIFL